MSAEVITRTASFGKSRYMFITVLVLALDQLSKYWVARVLGEGDDLHLIRGLLKFSYTENPGIAFGMLGREDLKWGLVAVSLVAITVVVFYLARTPASNRLLLWSLALLAAGISGNLIDRIRMGRVIDFIEVYYRDYHWPVFNVADSAITIGAALMAIELFLAPQEMEAGEPINGDDFVKPDSPV